MVILMALGSPFKWTKFRGGFELDCIGYFFSHRSYSLGISESRAGWVIGWIKTLLSEGIVSVSDFCAGLGRINYTTNVLIFDRPLLGILYTWASAISRSSAALARIPWAVRIVLFWISKRLAETGGCMIAAKDFVTPLGAPAPLEQFRTDAKATDTGAWIGGWETSCTQDTKLARWFAFEVLEVDFPWVFIKKDPKRVIAALELLGSVVAVMLFGKPGLLKGCTTIKGLTDNKSNTFAATKLLSTKFPLTILVMELIAQLREKGCQLQLDWISRDLNEPADDLTNCVYDRFSFSNRINVAPSELPFLVMPELQKASSELFLQLQKEKADLVARKLSGETLTQPALKKLRPLERLKWKDPW